MRTSVHRNMISIVWYYVAYTLIISCYHEVYGFGYRSDVRTLNGSVYPIEGSHVCRGGLQVDSFNDSQLLVAVCNLMSLRRYSGIGFMPMPDFETMRFSQVTVFYGDPNQTLDDPKQWNDGKPAKIVLPTNLIQKRDAIYFIENSSCLRMVNRTTGHVTTLKGKCGFDTMGFSHSIVSDKDAFGGMAITEDDHGGLTFFFSISSVGICTWNGDKSSDLEVIVHHSFTATGFPRVSLHTLFFLENGTDDFLIHKVTQGLNRYKMTNRPGIYEFRGKPWLTKLITSRFGSSNYYDPEARCVFPVNLGFSPDFPVIFSLSSDKSVLMITETRKRDIYLVRVEDLFSDLEPCNIKMDKICDASLVGMVDGNSSVCSFSLPTDSIWFSDSRVLTADTDVQKRTAYFRTFFYGVKSVSTSTLTTGTTCENQASAGYCKAMLVLEKEMCRSEIWRQLCCGSCQAITDKRP